MRQVREQVEVLEHHSDFLAHLVDLLEIVGELDAVDDDLALLVLLERIDAADHRRFARARRPGDDDALALLHAQVDVLEHVEVGVPFVDADQVDRDFVGDLQLAGVDRLVGRRHREASWRVPIACSRRAAGLR